jgi:hypothetical protein
MTNILAFPMPPQRALDLIRQAAKSGRVLLPTPPNGGEWYRIMTRRQVELCLREGEIVGNPEVDEYGNVACWLERFGAGLTVRLRVVLEREKDEEWEVIVLKVENRL